MRHTSIANCSLDPLVYIRTQSLSGYVFSPGTHASPSFLCMEKSWKGLSQITHTNKQNQSQWDIFCSVKIYLEQKCSNRYFCFKFAKNNRHLHQSHRIKRSGNSPTIGTKNRCNNWLTERWERRQKLEIIISQQFCTRKRPIKTDV